MRRRAAGATALAWFVVALAAHDAAACGHCSEDKIAAVYDYAAVTAATARGATLIYAAIDGGAALTHAARAARVRQALAATAGVDRGSVRVSEEPSAAFCVSSRAGAATEILARANARLRGDGVRLRALPSPSVAAARRR